MNFIQRLGYYLGGFSVGLIFLAIFLNGKRTSCSYFPDARVMKDIRMKKRYYSDQALRNLQELNIDTATVTQILHTGDVDFGRSNTELDSCNLYLVTGTHMERDLAFLFENCDSVATLQRVSVE